MVFKFVVDKLCGAIVVALYLVADDFYLFVYLGLWIHRVEDHIAEEVDSSCYVLMKDGSIVYGTLLGGIGLEVATYTLQVVEDVPSAASSGSFEGDMLAEVGKTFLSGQLVA